MSEDFSALLPVLLQQFDEFLILRQLLEDRWFRGFERSWQLRELLDQLVKLANAVAAELRDGLLGQYDTGLILQQLVQDDELLVRCSVEINEPVGVRVDFRHR